MNNKTFFLNTRAVSSRITKDTLTVPRTKYVDCGHIKQISGKHNDILCLFFLVCFVVLRTYM